MRARSVVTLIFNNRTVWFLVASREFVPFQPASDGTGHGGGNPPPTRERELHAAFAFAFGMFEGLW